jgi:hypothetical protein
VRREGTAALLLNRVRQTAHAATGSAAVAAVVVIGAHLLDPGSVLAQPLRQRLNTPGTAFVAETPAKLASMQDVGSGRRFRGKMNEMMWFRAAIRTPGANAMLQRIALHFRSDGPSLRTVDVMDGNVRVFHMEIPSLTGDYTRAEGNNNMWTFTSPYRVRGQ